MHHVHELTSRAVAVQTGVHTGHGGLGNAMPLGKQARTDRDRGRHKADAQARGERRQEKGKEQPGLLLPPRQHRQTVRQSPVRVTAIRSGPPKQDWEQSSSVCLVQGRTCNRAIYMHGTLNRITTTQRAPDTAPQRSGLWWRAPVDKPGTPCTWQHAEHGASTQCRRLPHRTLREPTSVARGRVRGPRSGSEERVPLYLTLHVSFCTRPYINVATGTSETAPPSPNFNGLGSMHCHVRVAGIQAW